MPDPSTMARRRSPLPDSLASRGFTTSEAAAAGVGQSRLTADDLVRYCRGFYVPGDAELTELEVITALVRGSPQVVVCSETAARLWGFPAAWGTSPWGLADPQFLVHLNHHRTHRRDSGRVRWHEKVLLPHEISALGDVRITSRIRTFLDLAKIFSHDDLVAVGDHLVRQPRQQYENRVTSHATMDALNRAVQDFHGPGARRALAAVKDVRVGSDSPAETRLRLAIARGGLPTPQLNVAISADGVALGEPDLSWPTWKICVEHDGPHHRSAEQQELDIERRERRENNGWVQVQTTARDLRAGGRRAVHRLTTQLRRQGWNGTPSQWLSGLRSS